MFRQLGEAADFEQLSIVPEGSTIMNAQGKYAKGLRDRPRYAYQGMSGAGHPMMTLPSFNHPMANFSGLFDSVGKIWDSATTAVTSAVTAALPKAETAAQEALAKVAGGVAQDIIAKPQVQAAISDTVKTQATQALATKIQSAATATSTFFTKYKTPILYGSIGVVVLGIAYTMFFKNRR